MIPIILSGGAGTRLWPMSRKAKPKQFLSITEPNTMLQSTALRIEGLSFMQSPIVVCNEEHRFLVAEQLREIEQTHQGIILEPEGRNTAAAIALAAFRVVETGGGDTILVLPSDHVITDTPSFHRALEKAHVLSEQGHLVTFGVVPTKPETGYGYIKKGNDISGSEGCWEGGGFVEKPDHKAAAKYLASGDYYWNGGMFMFKASVFLHELELFEPDIYLACQAAIEACTVDNDFIRVDEAAFLQCPAKSIDHAIMEKTAKCAVVALYAGWSDVGSWSAVWDSLAKDEHGNASLGDARLLECSNSLVVSAGRLVTALGLENIVVIESADAIMVASADKAQSVAGLVESLECENRAEAIEHREGFRPWGKYDCIDRGDRFQVKRITVKPGETLSLQMHHHRAEHWIVVRGTAWVRCGEETKLLTENQSTYIPLGELHQLSNPGKLDLELIEVQSGSYLGEDDIERFSDDYGRC